jgi:hypothetical protein
MKRRMYMLYPWLETAPDTPETLDLLIQAAKEAWHSIPEDVLRAASNGMPKRVQAIIAAEGWYTNRYKSSDKYIPIYE